MTHTRTAAARRLVSRRNSAAQTSPRTGLFTRGSLGFGAVVGLAVTGVLLLSNTIAPVSSAHADAKGPVTIAAAEQDIDIANAPFPDLKVTVSQTDELVAQGVTVSWTGGKQSTVPSGDTGGENFLQIMQCWGDDPASSVPVPDRTTCQYGAFNAPGATRDNAMDDKNVDPADKQYTVPGQGVLRPAYSSIPFRSVDGKVVSSIVDGKQVDVNVNQNEFFGPYTSNEVKWAGSGSGGNGSAKFEVQTALQSSGLGCGNPVVQADGSKKGKACWLVVVPRGTHDAGEQHVTKSGLFADNWKHRIAFRMDFKPLGISCELGQAERQLSGSELVAGAVASWQPTLCGAQGGATYTMSAGTESDALQSASLSPDASALALTSRPLAGPDGEKVEDSLAYAPVALAGVSVSFAIDRQPVDNGTTPPAALAKTGLPYDSMKLTPRLVAKLLTNSYLDALPTLADKKHLGFESTAKPGKNARNLTFDPDFLAINDADWKNESLVSPSLSDLLVPQGRSDALYQLWRYVMADADARAFLEGTPDPYGMVVNPYSSTSSTKNPTGTGLSYPRDDAPKADPVEQPESPTTGGVVNLVTWRPYTNDLDTGAYLTLRGDGQTLGAWDPQSAPPKYGKSIRNLTGYQRVLGLTDTASAAKYQVVQASLLNPAGQFVSPTSESLTAAAAAMTPTATQAQVYEYDPAGEQAKGAPTAYPLAMPVYAAAAPSIADEAQRADYAAFIRYAATTGQNPGTDNGTLPAGYAPIPAGWQDQAVRAAAAIQSGGWPPAEAPTGAGSDGSPTLDGSGLGDGAPTGSFANTGSTGGTVDAASASTDPSATGDLAADLRGPITPDDPALGSIGFAVPVGVLTGLASALAVPLLSRLRRRF